MLRRTVERDIIVQIEVWDRFDCSTKTGSRVLTIRKNSNHIKIYGADGGRYGSDRDGLERF